MINIDNKLVEHLANLAQLHFNDDEKEGIKNDLQNIIGLFEQINSLDTNGVEPLIYMNDRVNVLREDTVKVLISKEDALKNAPLHDDDYIKVPKVIQK